MIYTIREIKKEDNKPLASMIRKVLEEYGVNQPGTVYTDPTTDHLFELFKEPGSGYWIAEGANGDILGSCGIFPTKGLSPDCVELVKYYVRSDARGKGIGRALMEKSLMEAKKAGYSTVYLESLPELKEAVHIYEKAGFTKLKKPMGNSGHFACTIWMLKEL